VHRDSVTRRERADPRVLNERKLNRRVTQLAGGTWANGWSIGNNWIRSYGANRRKKSILEPYSKQCVKFRLGYRLRDVDYEYLRERHALVKISFTRFVVAVVGRPKWFFTFVLRNVIALISIIFLRVSSVNHAPWSNTYEEKRRLSIFEIRSVGNIYMLRVQIFRVNKKIQIKSII